MALLKIDNSEACIEEVYEYIQKRVHMANTPKNKPDEEYIAEMSTPVSAICRILLLDLNFEETKPSIKLAICKHFAE